MCHPLPHHVFSNSAAGGSSGGRAAEGADAAAAGSSAASAATYAALGALLDAVPPLSQLAASSAAAEALPDAGWRLLQWLLLHPRHGRALAAVPAQQVALRLAAAGAPASVTRGLAQAACVLQLVRGPRAPAPGGGAAAAQAGSGSAAAAGGAGPANGAGAGGGGSHTWAFHGTHGDAVHSILHQGLLNMSGLSMQCTGAAFGQGIYLSPDLSTAEAFAQSAAGWRHSRLGARLRCVLLCSVETAAAERAAAGAGGGCVGLRLAKLGSGAGAACCVVCAREAPTSGIQCSAVSTRQPSSPPPGPLAHNCRDTPTHTHARRPTAAAPPERYLVVPNPGAVRVEYVLLVGAPPASAATAAHHGSAAAAAGGFLHGGGARRRAAGAQLCLVLAVVYAVAVLVVPWLRALMRPGHMPLLRGT